jgi:hypothetical protein
VRTSSEPETFSCVFPFATSTVPITLACESFIVKPFFVMACCSWLRVVVLPGFIFTVARPFAKLTSTESTPDTDFKDTRTACAQTSQSIPKIARSMDLISAAADETKSSKTEQIATNLFISIS